MINEEIQKCANYYENSYSKGGLNAQRRYPNEELIRFLGRNFSEKSIEERKSIKILELGSGGCANLWMIAREGFDAYGIDISESSISLGKCALKYWGTNAELKFGSMTCIPFEDNTFDAVIDVFSSYCLSIKDFYITLDEVYRVLKKGGSFFSYTPSINSDALINYEPAKKIDEFTLDGIKRPTSPFYGNDYTFRFISPEDYKMLLQKKGFKVTYLETILRSYRMMKEKFEFVAIEGEKY